MTYEFYKVLHLVGFFLLLSGLMGAFFTVWGGNSFQGKVKSASFALHGTGILLVLISGFGLLAKLGYMQNMPTWIYFKIALWMFFALAISILKRKGQLGMPLYVLLLAAYAFAAFLGVYKPAI